MVAPVEEEQPVEREHARRAPIAADGKSARASRGATTTPSVAARHGAEEPHDRQVADAERRAEPVQDVRDAAASSSRASRTSTRAARSPCRARTGRRAASTRPRRSRSGRSPRRAGARGRRPRRARSSRPRSRCSGAAPTSRRGGGRGTAAGLELAGTAHSSTGPARKEVVPRTGAQVTAARLPNKPP